MKHFRQFTKKYQLSKTLRFELKPIGKTLDNIINSGLLEQDEHRAQSYLSVKKIIDEYHKAFIEDVLENVKLTYTNEDKKNSLEEFYADYMCKSKDETQKKHFEEVFKNLRKQIADNFSTDERFKRIDKKELIQKDLLSFVKKTEEKQLIEEFKCFTTYFTGFHENRRNMYSAKAQSTAIAYRLIHENLPRFIDNMSIFEKIVTSSEADKWLVTLREDFAEYLNVEEISEMFLLGYFNTVLTQKQIDVYNAIIGGKTIEKSNIKIKGLNEYINLYNQQQKDKSTRLPKLKPLYKQILSDRNAISWLPEHFESDEKLLEAIQTAYQELEEQVLNRNKEGEHTLTQLLQSLYANDLEKIYISNDQQLTDISQKVFGHWNTISKALLEELKSAVPKKSKKESDEAYEERLGKILKAQGSISIAKINQSVQALNCEVSNTLQTYFATLGAVDTDTLQKENLIFQIVNAYTEAKELLNTPYPANKNLAQDKRNVEKIKNLLDAVKALQHFVKPLLGDGTEPEKDEKFYGEFTSLWDELNKITPLYNKVRNYLTRKPYSKEKIKLNFENSTLMDGWDLNEETYNTTIILRKDGLYYLAVMNKKHNKVFTPQNTPTEGECYEKMEYKLLPVANKMLPKVFFSKSRINEFAPSKSLLSNYAKETHKKGINFNINDCHNLIDFFKESINKHEDWSKFNFQFSDTNSYEDLSGFYREVEQQGYRITFRKVSIKYIDKLVDDGKIYLFQIYNKDFSPYSKGTPNLHTIYWKMLFDEKKPCRRCV